MITGWPLDHCCLNNSRLSGQIASCRWSRRPSHSQECAGRTSSRLVVSWVKIRLVYNDLRPGTFIHSNLPTSGLDILSASLLCFPNIDLKLGMSSDSESVLWFSSSRKSLSNGVLLDFFTGNSWLVWAWTSSFLLIDWKYKKSLTSWVR